MKKTNSEKVNPGIRELSQHEIAVASGGITEPGGLFGPRNFAEASRFAGSLGLLYGSYEVGYTIGTKIYEAYVERVYNTP